MSNMGEQFKEMREDSKRRRARHREQSPRLLEAAGISFEEKNYGVHLIVKGSDGLIDFWPGTGRWISRCGKRGFGVRNLINYIKSRA